MMFSIPFRYTLSFSLLTLVCLIWYVFIYVSLDRAIDRYTHQYELLAAKQPHMSTITDGIASLKKEKHFLTKQLEQRCKESDKLGTRSVPLLLEATQKSGVTLDSWNVDSQKTQNSTQKMALSLSGSWEAIESFFSHLSSAAPLYCLSQLHIKNDDDNVHVDVTLSFLCAQN